MTDDETTDEGEARSTDPQRRGGTRAWLQLVRIPALFTAFADIAAGFAAKTTGFEPVGQLASLLTASGCLYLAGMILNDFFDRHRDAESRPERPIPAGHVSASAAGWAAAALIVAGLASAWSVSWQAFFIALGLAGCIVAYDGLLKATWLGPAAMGGCRFLNVMLGAAIDDTAASVWEMPQLVAACALGIYVLGITWFARTEEKTSSRFLLLGGAVVANLGMAILAGSFTGQFMPESAHWQREGTLLAGLVIVVAITVDRRIVLAVKSPEPALVQAAVKLMLLSIITLDATVVLAATGNVVPALAVALLVVPAMLIGRWLYLT